MSSFLPHRIAFLKTCRDHDLNNPLGLKDPIGDSKSESKLYTASLPLVKQKLNHYRSVFIKQQQILDKLQLILNDDYTKTNSLNYEKPLSYSTLFVSDMYMFVYHGPVKYTKVSTFT